MALQSIPITLAMYFGSALLVGAQGTDPDVAKTCDRLEVKTTWPEGTTSIECETLAVPARPRVGVVQLSSPPTSGEVVVPIILPPIVLKCRACNTFGCSDVSPNSLLPYTRTPGDCNGDGRPSVSDFVCVNSEIFRWPRE